MWSHWCRPESTNACFPNLLLWLLITPFRNRRERVKFNNIFMHTDICLNDPCGKNKQKKSFLQVLCYILCCILPPETASVFITGQRKGGRNTLRFVCQRFPHMLQLDSTNLTFTPSFLNCYFRWQKKQTKKKQHSGVVDRLPLCDTQTHELDWKTLSHTDSSGYKETRTVTSYHHTP